MDAQITSRKSHFSLQAAILALYFMHRLTYEALYEKVKLTSKIRGFRHSNPAQTGLRRSYETCVGANESRDIYLTAKEIFMKKYYFSFENELIKVENFYLLVILLILLTFPIVFLVNYKENNRKSQQNDLQGKQ